MSPDPLPQDPMDVHDRLPLVHQDARSSPSPSPQPSDADSERDAPAELMVVSRARRSNAGNRMSTLLAQTATDEQWGDEWEEAANEEEFVADDGIDQDDFNMDSSSSEDDDDDEGAEDDAGERELRKAERQERIKKRKTATNPFAAKFAAAARKKVKLHVPSAQSPAALAPRPKKKSERASWIPTPEDGPVRMSSRRLTVANKEHTLAKLKEKDRRRDDVLAVMKAAEARKAKDEPKALTQAERLTEAARTERHNSRSLHRWEEAEEQRAAERQAKLDALKNRQIEGPFIRFYSGPAVWVDDKLKYTGKEAPKIEELDEKLNKDLTAAPEASTSPVKDAASAPVTKLELPELPSNPPGLTKVDSAPSDAASHSQSQPPSSQHSQPPQPLQLPTVISSTASHDTPYPSTITFGPPQTSESFLSGIEQYASPQYGPLTQSESALQETLQHTQNHTRPPSAEDTQNMLPPNPFTASATQLRPHSPFPQPHPSLSDPSLPPNSNPQDLLAQFQRPPPVPAPPATPAPPKRKVVIRALRNLVILTSFSNLDEQLPTRSRTASSIIKERDRSALIQLSSTLFKWNTADATAFVTAMMNAPKTRRDKESGLPKSKRHLCAVTNMLARYRDPGTGIAYRDARAFSVIRGVVGGGFKWSGSLGCYVGGRPVDGVRGSARGWNRQLLGMKPAMGVPKRFLDMMNQPSTAAPTVDASAAAPADAGPATTATATSTASVPESSGEACAGVENAGEL